MKLIGYLNYKVATIENPYKQFNITGDLGGNEAKNVSLTFQTSGLEHSAVYYCAASKESTVTVLPFSSHKNFSDLYQHSWLLIRV